MIVEITAEAERVVVLHILHGARDYAGILFTNGGTGKCGRSSRNRRFWPPAQRPGQADRNAGDQRGREYAAGPGGRASRARPALVAGRAPIRVAGKNRPDTLPDGATAGACARAASRAAARGYRGPRPAPGAVAPRPAAPWRPRKTPLIRAPSRSTDAFVEAQGPSCAGASRHVARPRAGMAWLKSSGT